MNDPVTKEELTDAVAKGIQQAFISMGIDHGDPLQVQADMAFIRKLRLGSGRMTSSVVFAAVSGVFTMVGALIALGLQTFGKG